MYPSKSFDKMNKFVGPSSLPLFFFTLILTSQITFGQENQNSISVKLYSNISYSISECPKIFNRDLGIFTSEINKEFQIGYFTPSIGFDLKNGNYHEFEISRLLVNRTYNESFNIDDGGGQSGQMVNGDVTTNFLIAFRYEYNFIFLKNNEKSKLIPALGFSIDPYFSRESYKTKVSLSYPSTENVLGATASVIPRIIYNLTEIIFLDLNIPIHIIDVNYNTATNLQRSHTRTPTVDFIAFPSKYLIRFGIGLRL